MDSQKSIFCKYGPWKRINEFIVLLLKHFVGQYLLTINKDNYEDLNVYCDIL